MYEINYYASKNRMYIKIEGFIKLEEAKAFRKDSEKLHFKMKPGATFLMDAIGLKTLPQDSMEEIQHIRAHAVTYGVKKGAMVVKDRILAIQTKRTAKQIEGFTEEYFTSIEEATRFLDS